MVLLDLQLCIIAFLREYITYTSNINKSIKGENCPLHKLIIFMRGFLYLCTNSRLWFCAIPCWIRRSGNRLQLSLAVGSTRFPFQVFVIRYTVKKKTENSRYSTPSFTAAFRPLTVTLLICHLSLVLVVAPTCKRSQVLVIYGCGPGHKIRQSLLMDLLARKKLGLLSCLKRAFEKLHQKEKETLPRSKVQEENFQM